MNVVLQEEFRRVVRAELDRQGVSQAELARRLGIARPTVTQYLSGRYCPGLDVVEKFFIALEIPLQIGSAVPSERVESAN